MRIFLIGFMGSGKSTWGKWLAEKKGSLFLDLDEIIEKRANLKINDIFDSKGEDYFRELEAVCLRELAEKKDFILACGGGTPCYHDNMKIMNSLGVTVWLNTPKQVMVARLLQEASHRPLVRSLTPSQLQEYMDKKLDERLQYYQQATLTVDPTLTTVDELIHQIEHA